MSQKNKPDQQFTGHRARAMIDASERASKLIGEAEHAAVGGDLLLASRILEQLSANGSPLSVFYRSLAGLEHLDAFAARFEQPSPLRQRMDDLLWLRCHIVARRGDYKTAMDQLKQILDQRPWLRKAVQADSAFAPLHQLYAFRVLSGMQEPTTVENIDLLMSGQPRSISSAEKSK
jgi:hypothetical protein